MAVANQALNLKALKRVAESTPALQPYVTRFEMIRHGIEVHCADAVAWAVAYGSFVDLVGSRQSTRSRRRDKLLVVTTLPSFFEAVELLADKVLADVLLETGHLTDYRVWTLEEYRAVSAANGELLEEILRTGVTLFGKPPTDSARA